MEYVTYWDTDMIQYQMHNKSVTIETTQYLFIRLYCMADVL